LSGQRVHERHDVELPVTIIHDGQTYTGTTVNVSLGGMFVALGQVQMPFGAPVHVKVTLPAVKEEFLLEATVRWARPEGVGVQFGSLRAVEVWAFNQLFKSLNA